MEGSYIDVPFNDLPIAEEWGYLPSEVMGDDVKVGSIRVITTGYNETHRVYSVVCVGNSKFAKQMHSDC